MSSNSLVPIPERIIYAREQLVLGYQQGLNVGAGFYNAGNKCYINSVLQALYHTPVFLNWLKNDLDHQEGCTNQRCTVCAMKRTLEETQKSGGHHPTPILPVEILDRLKYVNEKFRGRTQEDAHEFLKYLLKSMNSCYIEALKLPKLDEASKNTTPIQQMFGFLQGTEITCLKCGSVSETFLYTTEIQLDVTSGDCISDLLNDYFKAERLEEYYCDYCLRKRPSLKQYNLQSTPFVLALQLKRFRNGEKVRRAITGDLTISLSKFVSKSIKQDMLDTIYSLGS